MKLRTCIAVGAAVACLLLPTHSALAEEMAMTPPPYVVVHIDEVEPHMIDEYEAGVREWVTAFAEAKMDESWTWFTSQGPDFNYALIFMMPDMASFDQEAARNQAMVEALGEEKVASLMSSMGNARSHYSELLKHLPELSYHPEGASMDPPGHIEVSVHTVRPGMEEAFQGLVKKTRAAFEQVGHKVPYDMYEVEFGHGTYVFTTPAESAAAHAALDPFPVVLAKALGEEAAGEILTEWRDCITHFETTGWTPRAELSYVPMMMMAEEAASSE